MLNSDITSVSQSFSAASAPSRLLVEYLEFKAAIALLRSSPFKLRTCATKVLGGIWGNRGVDE
ncbi:hypothetical protein D3C78_1896650 [compost metagenome]